MPVKPAKQQFDREEISEILRRNIALYKDEEGFADYLVELSGFFFCHALMEESVSRLEKEDPFHPPTPAPVSPQDDEDLDLQTLPPTVAERRRKSGEVPVNLVPNFEPFRPMPSPPPPPPPKRPPLEPLPRAGKEEESAAAPPPSREVRKSRVFQVKSAGARFRRPTDMQPSPQKPRAQQPPLAETPSNPPVDDPRKKGSASRTRIFRLGRPSSSIAEYACQICGAMIPGGSRRCPGCGAEVL